MNRTIIDIEIRTACNSVITQLNSEREFVQSVGKVTGNKLFHIYIVSTIIIALKISWNNFIVAVVITLSSGNKSVNFYAFFCFFVV